MMSLAILLATLIGCGWATADQAGIKQAIPSANATRVEVTTLEKSDATLALEPPGEVAGSRDAMPAAANGG